VKISDPSHPWGTATAAATTTEKQKKKKKKEKQEKLAKISSFLQHFLRLLVSCFLIFFGWSFGFWQVLHAN